MRKPATIAFVAVAIVTAVAPSPSLANHHGATLGTCIAEARQVLGGGVQSAVGSFDNVELGTPGDDDLSPTAGSDLLCGFAGSDEVTRSLGDGDVFIGGPGIDILEFLDGGTFIGGDGDDRLILELLDGTFVGGPGDDVVREIRGGTFDGGPGDDTVVLYTAGRCVDVEAGC